MARTCTCPVSYNIFIGVFLVALSIGSWLKLFSMVVPIWLSLIMFIFGLLSIILNSINRSYTNADDLNVEQVNKIHANEGF